MLTRGITVNCLGASNTRIIIGDNGEKVRDFNYPTLLSLRIGATVRNYGKSGTNMSVCPGRDDSYLERARTMEPADLIIVQGEGNDASHGLPLGNPLGISGNNGNDTATTAAIGTGTGTGTGGFVGDVTALICYLRREYPDARLLFLTAMRKGREPNRADGLTHADFHAAYVAACRREGIEPIDFYTDPVMNPSDKEIMPDGVHMSERGCIAYADRLARIIAEL